jgi:hypothetical protein
MDIYCNDLKICQAVPVLDRKFEWTVGRKFDGTSLSPGVYGINVESWDFDSFHYTPVTLVNKIPKFPLRPFIERIPLRKAPGCPMCFQIDPRELKFDPMSVKEPITIVITRGRHIFAKLGKFGPKLALPGQVLVRLDEEQHKFIKNRRHGFELRVISADGKILHQQAVQLEIVR